MGSRADLLVQSDFESFARKCFRSTHGELLGDQRYVSYLCAEIFALERGETSRLIINLPPRHLKSFVCTVCLAAWRLAQKPSSHILLVTYSEPLARKLARGVQDIIRLPWYQRLFATRIARHHSSVTDFATIQGGELHAVSVGGSITGFGADLLIFDDPLNIIDADNELQIERINDVFYPSLMSRLNHPRTDPVVIVAHRLHENDLSGFLMAEGGWNQVALPFLAPEDAVHGKWRRRAGELLRPDAYSDRDVARIKASRSFATLYQQCAGSRADPIVPADFGRFSSHELPQRPAVVLSVDANQCKGARNSFSVIQAWCNLGKEFLLLDQWRAQCNYEELWDAYRRMRKKHNPAVVLIERAANGYPLIRDAKRRGGNLRIVDLLPDQRSKEERLSAQAAVIKAGRVRLPRHADFLEAYIAEFTASKRTAFDQIDATVQYLAWVLDQPPLQPPPPRALGVKASRMVLAQPPSQSPPPRALGTIVKARRRMFL